MSAVAVGVSHPAFRRGLFFLSFIFINSVVYVLPFLSLFFFPSFLPLTPPPFFFIFPLVCFERTAKGFAWTLPLRFLNLATCKRSIFAYSFLCFGTVVLSLESSSVEAISFTSDVHVGSSVRSPEPAEPCRSARAHFGAARPSGRRRFPRPPAAFLRFPGGRAALPAPLRSQIAHPASPGFGRAHGVRLSLGGGTMAVLSPRNICKTLRGNYRFVWRLFRRFLVTKWQWVWIFQGFLGTRSVMSATVFISVLLRARGRILCCGRIIISIMLVNHSFYLWEIPAPEMPGHDLM